MFRIEPLINSRPLYIKFDEPKPTLFINSLSDCFKFMFQIEYIRKENFSYVEFFGEIELKEILSYINTLGENSNLPQDICILQNFQNAQFNFHPCEIKIIGEEMRKYENLFNTVRVAAVYANPREIAYGQLIEQHCVFKNYTHKIFHSLEAASAWLKHTVYAY